MADFPVTYIENFTEDYLKDLPDFDKIWDSIPWERRSDAPRFECWMNNYGMSYTYGRGTGARTYIPIDEWNVWAARIRDEIYDSIGPYLEGCFINGYGDQRDHLGYHADDSPDIDHTKPIAIVSLGEEREIWFRKFPVETVPHEVMKLKLASGSLCLMAPGMQFEFQHRIPKASFAAGRRISFTYRSLIPR